MSLSTTPFGCPTWRQSGESSELFASAMHSESIRVAYIDERPRLNPFCMTDYDFSMILCWRFKICSVTFENNCSESNSTVVCWICFVSFFENRSDNSFLQCYRYLLLFKNIIDHIPEVADDGDTTKDEVLISNV